MSKNSKRGLIVLAIVLAVFTVIAFVVPFAKTGAFWTAYVFGVIAIAVQLYVFKISAETAGEAKSRFYGFPIAKIGVIYLIVQLILSLIEMLTARFLLAWIAVISDVIVTAVALIGCIAAEAMRDEIVSQDDKLKKDVSGMRALQSLAISLSGQTENGELKEKLQKLSDEFKYSDPVTSDQTAGLEEELSAQLREIQSALLEGDNASASSLASKALTNLKERNRICALNK